MSNPVLKDLNELVDADVISAETAERITQYYNDRKPPPNQRFNIVLGILGSLLIGSGIVLLVAHNWDQMSRSTQTIFAFLPLLVGQAACLFILFTKKNDVSWREGSSVVLFFAMASCLALVSQIYHINGTLKDFIVTWLMLTAPLIYIMRSSLVSLFVIACATWYVSLAGYQDIFNSGRPQVPYRYLVFVMFTIPHYYQYVRSKRKSNFFHVHNWFYVLSLIVALGAFVGKSSGHYQWIFIAYCALFGIFYLLGTSKYLNDNRLFANPFLVTGIIGTAIIFLLWSYDGVWSNLVRARAGSFFFVAVSLLVVQTWLLIKFNAKSSALFDPVPYSAFALTAAILLFGRLPAMGQVFINAWILLIAMFYIRKGARKDHLGILNFGLLIIACLALLRFFDEGIPFVWRGLFFVATGIGFFLANYFMLKKRRAAS